MVVVAVLVMIWRNRADAVRRKMKSACPENCRQKMQFTHIFLVLGNYAVVTVFYHLYLNKKVCKAKKNEKYFALASMVVAQMVH